MLEWNFSFSSSSRCCDVFFYLFNYLLCGSCFLYVALISARPMSRFNYHTIVIFFEGFGMAGHPPVPPPWGSQSLAEIPPWTQPVPSQSYNIPVSSQPTPLFPPEQDAAPTPYEKQSFDSSSAPADSYDTTPSSHSLPSSSQVPPTMQSAHSEAAPPSLLKEESSRSPASQPREVDDVDYPPEEAEEQDYERRSFRHETQSYDYNHT